jgi:hypothetical protein
VRILRLEEGDYVAAASVLPAEEAGDGAEQPELVQ